MKLQNDIVFFGTEDFSATSLTALIKNGFNVTAVITKPDSRRGRKNELVEPIIKTVATRHNIPVFQPEKSADIFDVVKNINGTGVLVSYGKILPPSVLGLFPGGIVNVHPSLLPKYRGPSPIESAILNGDQQTGVTIMKLSAQMDAGPIYSQQVHPLNGTETRLELRQTLAHIGAYLLVNTLPKIISGSLNPVAQQSEQATYCSMLKKSDGQLDIEQNNALTLERQVRAYLGYPKTKLSYNGQDIIVTNAKATNAPSANDFTVACAKNSLLQIVTLIAPSGRTMSGADYLRGYPSGAGGTSEKPQL